jgi:hypothetical protein
MNTYVLAALLGLASTVAAQWTQSYTVFNSNGYSLDTVTSADYIYGTYYLNDQASTGSGDHFEYYGLEAYTYGELDWTLTYNTYAVWEGTHTFYLFDVIPYEQELYFTRPITGSASHAYAVGNYDVTLLTLNSVFTESYETLAVSFYNDLSAGVTPTPTAADWSLSSSGWTDPYYSVDLFSTYIDQGYSWYGSNNYYTQQLW